MKHIKHAYSFQEPYKQHSFRAKKGSKVENSAYELMVMYRIQRKNNGNTQNCEKVSKRLPYQLLEEGLFSKLDQDGSIKICTESSFS